MVPPAIEASGGVFVLNVVWRIDVSCQECLVTFYECIREEKCHFHLFFAINTKLTYLFSSFLRLLSRTTDILVFETEKKEEITATLAKFNISDIQSVTAVIYIFISELCNLFIKNKKFCFKTFFVMIKEISNPNLKILKWQGFYLLWLQSHSASSSSW